jgi:hypothetical protein
MNRQNSLGIEEKNGWIILVEKNKNGEVRRRDSFDVEEVKQAIALLRTLRDTARKAVYLMDAEMEKVFANGIANGDIERVELIGEEE